MEPFRRWHFVIRLVDDAVLTIDITDALTFSYGLTREARVKGVMLRWWQPRHNGAGHDQWALDHVEVVL